MDSWGTGRGSARQGGGDCGGRELDGRADGVPLGGRARCQGLADGGGFGNFGLDHWELVDGSEGLEGADKRSGAGQTRSRRGSCLIDTTFLISHRLLLGRAPDGYKMFKENQNEVTKVVLKPDWRKEAA